MKNTFHIATFLLTIAFSFHIYGQQNEIDSLKRALHTTKSDTVKVNLYNKISNQYKESNADSTARYAERAIRLAQQSQYDFGMATAYLNSGNSCVILGNYTKALLNFDQSVALFSKLVDLAPTNSFKNGLAKAYASKGVVYTEQNNYPMALDNYQKALRIQLEIGQKNTLSKTYNNIGIVYKSEGNHTKALDYLKKALQLQEQMGDPAAAMSLTNIGVLYFEQNNLIEAYKYYTQAQKLFQTIDNQRGFALLNNYWGDYYRKVKKEPEANSAYQIALKLYEDLRDKHGAAQVLCNLGTLYFDQKKYTDAMLFATKSLDYAKEIGLLDQVFHTEKLISTIYEGQGNYEQSLLHYKAYTAARDSINNLENGKKLVRSEMNFEYQMKSSLLAEQHKKQQLIILFLIIASILTLGLVFVIFNRRQVKRRLTLQKEVTEYEQKALHLQMNPHFVFNCLGAISSFIVQNGTDSALKYLSKFSKLMRLTLEYSKDSLIPIDKEIESLQNYLELEQLRFHNSFTFAIESSETVEFNMGLPPLLIQPFVENAILHGLVPKEGHGNINVNFDVQNKQLICTITDNGIGITKSTEMKENSMTAHQSMALEITKKRLEIMEATLSKSAQIEIKELESNNQVVGTRVTLRLPIQYME